MKVRINDTWLARGGREGTSNVAFNGTQVIQEAQFFRAQAAKWFARGNRSSSFSFSVARTHGSTRDAEEFLFTHRDNLPHSGDLVITCGLPGDELDIAFPGAVLEGVSAGYRGPTTFFTYTFRCGLPETDSIPAGGEVDEEVTRRGTVAIGAGETSVEVEFPNAMTGTPVVVASILTPDSGDQIFATIREDSVSASGFTADLSGPTPGGDYKLSYIAIL